MLYVYGIFFGHNKLLSTKIGCISTYSMEILTYCSNIHSFKLFQKHCISFTQHLENISRNEY